MIIPKIMILKIHTNNIIIISIYIYIYIYTSYINEDIYTNKTNMLL